MQKAVQQHDTLLFLLDDNNENSYVYHLEITLKLFKNTRSWATSSCTAHFKTALTVNHERVLGNVPKAFMGIAKVSQALSLTH
ncbi:MAG: hypothetical protein LAC70_00675 [Methylovulum sp.]|nr:hypothetical protein [Methylovulum sp.]